MPLHEYECDVCGRRFEKIQKFSDPPIEVCPTCGGPVHKLFSSPAFQFKGSGWYITDYPKKDQAGGTKTGEKDETASKDKSEKTDTADKVDKADKTDKSSSTSTDSTSTSQSTTSTRSKKD